MKIGRVAPFAFVGLLVMALVIALGIGAATAARERTPASGKTVTAATKTNYRGLTAEAWARKFRGMRHLAYARLVRTKQLKRTLLNRPSVVEAINLACVVYGNCSTLWRKASCETGGTFDPHARNNPSADSPMGLFEFKPSTFARTPFARFSIWSPYASSLAAGWMHVHGHGGEWQCR